MKISSFFIGLLISLSALASKVEVDVPGMTCGMCIGSITKELKKTEKVQDILVSLEDKKARFNEVKDKKISDDEIKAAIKSAGYEATKIKRH